MDSISRVAQFMTDESVIRFQDGEEFKGAREVAKFILNGCKSYTSGYMKAVKHRTLKGLAIGVTVAGIGMLVYRGIETRRTKLKKEET